MEQRAVGGGFAAEQPTPGGTCMICLQERDEGIRICEEFICLSCEREMVSTDVKDERYPFFVHQMRQIWHHKNA